MEITREVIQDWKTWISVTCQMDCILLVLFNFTCLFYLCFMQAHLPWSHILTSNKATWHTPAMQSCKAGLAGQLGSGNPPVVYLLCHVLSTDQSWRTTIAPCFIQGLQGSPPSPGSSALRAKGAFSQHRSSGGNTQTCFLWAWAT